MECPLSPDPGHDRLTRATARLNAAMTQVSLAEEVLAEAKQRLTLARLELQKLRHPSTDHNPPADDDAMDPK
jgi:exonuclease VII small subunit